MPTQNTEHMNSSVESLSKADAATLPMSLRTTEWPFILAFIRIQQMIAGNMNLAHQVERLGRATG